MNRNSTISSPLLTTLRRAAATALLLGSMPLASCAELATALNTASQGFATYQQVRTELEHARSDCTHTTPYGSPTQQPHAYQPPAGGPVLTQPQRVDPVVVLATELMRLQATRR